MEDAVSLKMIKKVAFDNVMAFDFRKYVCQNFFFDKCYSKEELLVIKNLKVSCSPKDKYDC